MGYTHYWEITTDRISREDWNKMCAAAEQVFELVQRRPGIKLVYGASRTSPPVTNESAIRFNGHPTQSGAYEDCIIRRSGSSCCKTGSDYGSRQPYDLAVVAVLNACSLVSDSFVWHSDGTTEQLAEGMEIGRQAYAHAMRNPVKEAKAEIYETTVPAAPAAGTDQVQSALQTLMAALGTSGQVNPEQVREIVRAELADYNKPTRVEIVTNGGEPRTLPNASHKVLPDVLKFLAQGVHVMLVGPAGSGKTTLAMQAAEALGREFSMSGAILQKYELLGYQDANGRYVRSVFRDRYEHGGLFLWDEIDASSPAALVAFNAALENGHADFPDGQVKRHPDFICVAAANTYGHGATREYIGRNALDGATLDRYAVITMDYDEALEEALAGNTELCREVQAYRRAAQKLGVKHIVSPRASIRGARMLAAGMDKSAVLGALVWKGLPSEQVSKIQQEAGYESRRF